MITNTHLYSRPAIIEVKIGPDKFIEITNNFINTLVVEQNQFYVDWGDGSNQYINFYQGISHTYSAAGIYEIRFSGTKTVFPYVGDKLIRVKQFGNFYFDCISFRDCTNLLSIPEDSDFYIYEGFAPNFNTGVELFYNCKSLLSIPENILKKTIGLEVISNMFKGCESITSIPANLFKYNTNLLYVDNLFNGCKSLTSIPADLFKYNTNIYSFKLTFVFCDSLTSIPATLFKYNVLATNFEAVFYACKNLLSIPATLFKYNVLATNFTSAFGGYISPTVVTNKITTIPDTLFYFNTKVESFNQTFANCTNLTTISPLLFSQCVDVINFEATFYGCSKLLEVPSDLFAQNKKAYGFRYTFENCIKAKLNIDVFGTDYSNRFSLVSGSATFNEMFYIEEFTGPTPGSVPDLWNYSHIQINNTTNGDRVYGKKTIFNWAHSTRVNSSDVPNYLK